ncbi:MAG: hypothetical protein J0L66_10575 [Cytophagales bacterium]|nr:hypothetical protein [Cytophagales bacterium]
MALIRRDIFFIFAQRHFIYTNVGSHFMGRLFNLTILILISCSSQDRDFQSITFDTSNDFKIINEDSVYNALEGVADFQEIVKITSDTRLISDSDFKQMDEIKFSEARIESDTLDILLYETNSIFDYKYKIKIVDGKFKIDFWYQTTIDTIDREIRTLKQTLILNKREFKKGDEIRGHTEYEGQCIKGCSTDENPIIIKGNFKVKVE